MNFGISEDGKTIKTLYFDGKMYSVSIINGENSIDLNQLHEAYEKVVEDKPDQCKNIVKLGAAISGSPDVSRGFLLGWVVKSIKDKIDADTGIIHNISVEEEVVSKEEIRNYTVESLRNLANEIEEMDIDKTPTKPMVVNDIGGDDVF